MDDERFGAVARRERQKIPAVVSKEARNEVHRAKDPSGMWSILRTKQ